MAVIEDWYPNSLADREVFHTNLENNLPSLAVKYDISAATLTSVAADAEWLRYWAQARQEADLLALQLTAYINTIKGNKKDVDPPAPINFSLTGAAPAEVLPGIEARTRELRREFVGKSIYAAADGELLGFVAQKNGAPDLSQKTPVISSLRTMDAYKLEAVFSKQGMDAVRFEYRRKGGNWTALSDEPTSPAMLTLTPAVAGEAEQIEIRAIFLLKYHPVGIYSPSYTVIIAP